MKKLQFICVLCLLLGLSGCGGKISSAKIQPWEPSMIYTDAEIEDAIDVILYEFDRKWDGGTLREITYAGDEKSLSHHDWATRNNAEDAIVLISAFDVDASGGDGSLNPNSTYTKWMWILVRTGSGKWKHVDHGY